MAKNQDTSIVYITSETAISESFVRAKIGDGAHLILEY